MSSTSISDSEGAVKSSSSRSQIREELSSMTFEEIMKLKEELGAKVYREAIVYGVNDNNSSKKNNDTPAIKRLNKNRPREITAKKQVPFLGVELRSQCKKESVICDPRFDEKSGTYDPKTFKENYKFLSTIRQKEIASLKKELAKTRDQEQRSQIKHEMQKLINKNVEERKWHAKQNVLKEERNEVQRARAEGKQPRYTTMKERRTKELVMQFESLKKYGKLNKHLEKRRKKNAAKDRKKINFD